MTLSRAKFHEVNLDVKEPGSYIEWEFETKCRDIGFGLFFNEMVDGEEKITELVPIQRIDTEDYPETGTIPCEHPGTCKCNINVYECSLSVQKYGCFYFHSIENTVQSFRSSYNILILCKKIKFLNSLQNFPNCRYFAVNLGTRKEFLGTYSG